MSGKEEHAKKDPKNNDIKLPYESIKWQNPTGFNLLNVGLQEPCKDGTLLVRHAYSECRNGFWHVVEDDYYLCPPNKEIKKFRVYDNETQQRCGIGQPPVNVALTWYKDIQGDPNCQAPKLIGEIVIPECVNGFWENATYNLYECLDGSRRISSPPKSRIRTNVQCEEAPPSPIKK